MAKEERPEDDEIGVAFTRWQGRTIQQLGYALNLILTLSVAALGYELAVLLNENLTRIWWQNWLFAASIICLIGSVSVGLWCVINRLQDFRTTTRTARKREEGVSDRELEALRSRTRSLGKRTWALFWGQIVSFGFGMLLLVVAMAGTLIKALIGAEGI